MSEVPACCLCGAPNDADGDCTAECDHTRIAQDIAAQRQGDRVLRAHRERHERYGTVMTILVPPPFDVAEELFDDIADLCHAVQEGDVIVSGRRAALPDGEPDG